MMPTVLVIEFREGLGNELRQIVSSKGVLVDMLTDLKDLDRKSIPLFIKKNVYRLVIINYQMALDYKPFDILAYVKEHRIPYAIIYTSAQRASTAYEIYAFWSLVITDEMKSDLNLLVSEIKKEFVLPPDGSLKFAL